MYIQHFGLKELPFSIAPDPRYLFMSEQHREALAHLAYGINSDGGFVLLTGEVGTGKTTVCRCFLEQIPENTDIAFIFNPKMTVEELLASFCDELGIIYPEGNTSIKVFVDQISKYLLGAHAKGRRTVLIIEEAQNLNPDVLEQVRLLTNLETNQQKLLQIIMVGQPELKDILSRPELLQLSQRITARYHIGPLSKKDVAVYVNHRLAVAGASSRLFPDSLINKLYRLSRGVPRLINMICDRALLGAYVQGQSAVDKKTLVRAAHEVFGETNVGIQKKKILQWAVIGFVLISSLAALAATYYNYKSNKHAAKASAIEEMGTLLWPVDQPIERSKDIAFEMLFNQWNISYQIQGDSACKQAQAKGLRCLDVKGNFFDLNRLNKPAVLKLFDEKGQPFYAALTNLQGNTAKLIIGNKTLTFHIKEIEKRWFGDYILLWRPPQNYHGNIHPGYKGPAVEWLERQLSIAQGLNPEPRSNLIYNNDLVRGVKKFQLSVSLVPDGVVGPHTIILLNNASGTNDPVLMKKGKDN